jgi:hypothetical protein
MKNKKYRVIGLGLSMGLSVLAAHAQTGPGGVSAVGAATNLKLWLRADQGVYINGGTTTATNGQSVQQWNDFSGNSAHAVNAVTTSTRPTYAVGTGGNGFPALNFSSAAAQTITAAINIQPAVIPNLTIVAVSKTTSTAFVNAKLWGHDAPTQSSGFMRSVGFDSRGTTSFAYFTGGGVANFGTVSANTNFISTSNYTTSTFNGYLNGNQTVTNGPVSNTGGLTALSIGSITPTSEFWDGTVSEFIAYNKSLALSERKIVEAYLAAKYSIAITGDIYTMDDPANGDYDYEAAGIGTDAAGGTVTVAQGTGILTISNATTLTAGRYFMFGHDNGPLTLTGSNQPPGFTSRLARIWRPSEAFGDVGTMTLAFDVTQVSGAPANVSNYSLLVDRNNNGSFADESQAGAGIIPASAKVGNVVTFNGVNVGDAQRFSMAFTNTVALPLDLVAFTAAASGTENQIRWETANEKSISSMEVQKSSDGVEFRKLSAREANNSGSYTTIDAAPGTITYYRLRLVNQDGSQSFSSIEKVVRQNTFGPLRISPNPASTVARISGLPGTEASIRLYDASGKLVLEKSTSDINLELSMSNYPAGTYNLIVDAEGFHSTQRVVKR